ncbi:hypothetical protein [Desmospora profundinema]|uniref:Tetratricopeptide repeat protein n=1 Tax=Desmospora profundinema TaxID=1571184 RepID=A0ABU1IHV3_9BACL|nr:hypothetical protein [Desmospora profundinema]MDR6224271.1 hypothetical protein [Desmospora profundinema]
MIEKWLNKAKQWFKPSDQSHSSATTVATKEDPATPSKTNREHSSPDPGKTEAVNHPDKPASDPPSEEQQASPDTSPDSTPSPDVTETAPQKAEESPVEEKEAAPSPGGIDQTKSETASAGEDEPVSSEPGYRIEEGRFHFRDEDFSFTMPIDEEEQQILKEADAKTKEALDQLDEENDKQRKHWEAKRYWSLQIHYRDRAQHFYKLRDQESDALTKAIFYCEKMIRYAPMAIYANRIDPQAKELPQHYGYKQLAIIREREGDLNEAIRLCRQALDEGWKGDWAQRMERYSKKLNS